MTIAYIHTYSLTVTRKVGQFDEGLLASVIHGILLQNIVSSCYINSGAT